MRTLRILAINLILSILAIGLSVFVLWLGRQWFAPLPAWLEWIAWPLFVLGSLLILWAAFTLAKHSGTSAVPGDPTSQLVDSGPYRWMRNPIYAGDILLVFGVAFFTRSLLMLILAVLLMPCLDWFVRKVEEPRTARRLGQTYIEYTHRVSRWFPRCPKDEY